MKEKKKIIRVIICFLLVASIASPSQVESKTIQNSNSYVSLTQKSYTSSNSAKFKTIKSSKRHKSSRPSKSKVKLKKRSTKTKRYGNGTIGKHRNRSIRRNGITRIISNMIKFVILILIVIVIFVIIVTRRKKKRLE